MTTKNVLKTAVLILGLLSCGFAQAQSKVGFYTSMGDWEVELTDTLTPVTVDSFLARVTRGFYDGTIFHRVVDNFMIQGGDPTGTGSGGTGTTIPDEFHATLKNVPGALAMANIGQANTGDCQFFINLVTNNHLNNRHTVFGMVTQGFDVVQDIGKVPTGPPNNRPTTPVTLDSIRVLHLFVPDPGPSTAVISLGTDAGVRVFPNPANDVIHISSRVPVDVSLSGMDGRMLLRSEDASAILLHDFAKGLYLLQVRDKSGNLLKVEQIMKQ
jgi:cyclophilin family peptidyl-prolyl cis-trans isomerase